MPVSGQSKGLRWLQRLLRKKLTWGGRRREREGEGGREREGDKKLRVNKGEAGEIKIEINLTSKGLRKNPSKPSWQNSSEPSNEAEASPSNPPPSCPGQTLQPQ